MSMPMFLGTRNWRELFCKASGQRYCQFCTTGLSDNVILAVLQHDFGVYAYVFWNKKCNGPFLLFRSSYGQQCCQICITGLPENVIFVFTNQSHAAIPIFLWNTCFWLILLCAMLLGIQHNLQGRSTQLGFIAPKSI